MNDKNWQEETQSLTRGEDRHQRETLSQFDGQDQWAEDRPEDAEGPIITDDETVIKRRKLLEKPLVRLGLGCIAIIIALFIYSGTETVDHSPAAKEALESGFSKSMTAGSVLLSKDQEMTARDYTIQHKTAEDQTRIWIWDYAAEDGDYVQVLVNGAPMGEAFFIKHQPVELTVPSVGLVQVKGVRDGGGGITYAVRYELNGTTYFNGTPPGELNTYTLQRE